MEKTYAQTVAEAITQVVGRVDMVVVSPGEESKSIETASTLWQGMVELKADRKSVVVAVGGGVVGDLAGFIAATYARGLPFLQVPTTLLAQVDSSVGGKVGINLPTARTWSGPSCSPWPCSSTRPRSKRCPNASSGRHGGSDQIRRDPRRRAV